MAAVEPKWKVGIEPDSYIWLEFGWDQDLVSDIKRNVPGARWNPMNKHWRFPPVWEVCLAIRKVANEFGADLDMTGLLIAWATEEKARQATIPNVQSMGLVDLPNVRYEAPELWAALSNRPFQTVGAAFAARNRSCLVADDPGLGKTLQTIAAVIESGVVGPILVVAPKAAAELTWLQELDKWAPGDSVLFLGASTPRDNREAVLDGFLSIAKRVPGRFWILTTPNYIRMKGETDEYGNYLKVNGHKVVEPVGEGLRGLIETTWSTIIVDESHDTLAGCSGNKKKQSAQRQGLGELKVQKNGLRIALSGTPFRGKESYLWGQLNWLRPDLYRSYWKWVEKFFPVDKSGFGWSIGEKVDKEGIYADASQVMIRRTKAEVAPDLPAKQYAEVWLDMAPKQAKAYEGMLKSAAAEIEGGTLMTNGVLAELTRLKQFSTMYGKLVDDEFVPSLPSNKFDWLVQWMSERGIDDGLSQGLEKNIDLPKVVVVSQFTTVLNAFAKGLIDKGIHAHSFTGSTSSATREAIKDDWQNNPGSALRVLLLSTKAGGVSLTLDAADDMIILDETWSNADQLQVEDRIHRLSRMHQVTIWKVFSRNTIEEAIAKLNQNKEFSIKSIMDGERGVEFAKAVLQLKEAA